MNSLRRLFGLMLVLSMGLGCGQTCLGQSYDTVRVMTYNLLNYPGNNSPTRNPEFRKILRYVNPDILIVQEMVSAAGVTEFLNNALNAGQPGMYSSVPFVNGPDTDNSMFYKSSLFSFQSQIQLHTLLRDITSYQLRPVGVNSDSVDLRIFSAHLHSSQGNESDRFAEADTLRNYLNALPDGLCLMAGGDFNLYTSTEAAYQELIGTQDDNSGRLYDPINTPGTWNDHESFANIHTQSTRTENLSDGGAVGGLDDRFDFLLLSYTFQSGNHWHYVSGSYDEVGNDGNHFNLSVNAGTNTAVPDSIADALHLVSDHLPVYLDLYRQTQGSNPGSMIVLLPNGGETWFSGSSQNITWTSQNLNGTVSIKLNRNYPVGTWENVVLNTANDGSQAWIVTLPATSSARIQVLSDTQPTVSDLSDGNFSIVAPTITLISPNGGNLWYTNQSGLIQWGTVGITGNVRIELDRNYPSGSWQILYGSAINDGNELWMVTGPVTTHARLRIFSINNTTIGDTSAGDFSIITRPPVIAHDPHGDSESGSITFTASITDDLPGVSAKLFWSNGQAGFDSIALSTTGFPNEFAASLTLAFGHFDYFIRAMDSEFQSSSTDTFSFVIADQCGIDVWYDDSTPESYQWSTQDSFAWAVKFSPPVVPFVLCGADISIASFNPDTSHDQIIVQILAADGLGGLPGTELLLLTRGSIGNVIGGLPENVNQMAHIVLYDNANLPVVVNNDFYIAVQNSDGGTEAFGLDTSSALANRSYFFNPCVGMWLSESSGDTSARRGNRIIHLQGWQDASLQLVIRRVNDDLTLNWNSVGAPYYRIYQSVNSEGPTWDWVGTASDTTFTDIGAVNQQTRLFYRVHSSSMP